MHGGLNWERHPDVRTGSDLTFGERSADRLKAVFGSWGFLIGLNTFIVGWIVLNAVLGPDAWDLYPFILLNLGLSWLAAQQGGALQIAANRGDRISSEVALSTRKNSEWLLEVQDEILKLQKTQMQVLATQDQVLAEIRVLADARKAREAK